MSDILGYSFIFIVIFGPIPLTIGLFFLAHWLEKKFPKLDKHISLSLLTGIIGLIFGLSNSRIPDSNNGILFSNRDPAQGWPLYWFGSEGLSSLGFLYPALGDIIIVALIAFIGFSLMSRLSLTILKEKVNTAQYILLVILFAAVPIWLNWPTLMHNVYTYGTLTRTSNEMSKAQLEYWLNKNARPVLDSVQLLQCNGFELVPSKTYSGTMDIQLSVIANFQRPENIHIRGYLIIKQLLDLSGKPMESSYNDRPYKWEHTTLPEISGEQEIKVIYPVQVDSGSLTVNKPGPYIASISVDEFDVRDNNWYSIPVDHRSGGIEYARDVLGIPDKKLTIECQTPPYKNEELGTTAILGPTISLTPIYPNP